MYDPAHPFGRKAVQLAVIDPVSCTGCGWKVNCFYGAVTILPPQVR